MRRTGLASLLAMLLTVAGLGLAVPGALAAGSGVGSFEIDGNTVDSPAGEPIDWETPPPNLTNFTDATGSKDDSFNNGSKETLPGNWSCATGSAPGKDDITAGQIAFRTISGKQYVYVDYTRKGVNGDAHINYELNQSGVANASCPALPRRTDGDIVLTFDTENGGAIINVNAYRWSGGAVTGTFTPLALGQQGTTWDGAVNIPNSIPGHIAGDFGEAVLNLTDTIGTIACGQFATAYMKTRSSTSISAALQDRTSTKPIQVGDCPSSSLAKAVRNVTKNGSFATTASAVPGDTIEYQLTYKNSGPGAATNVDIADTIQPRQTFVSCSQTPPCTTDGPPVTTVKWHFDSVAANTTKVVTFQVRLDATFPSGSTTVKNVDTVTTKEEGTKSSNETTVTVAAAPQLKLLKSADTSSTVVAGNQITYTLAYSNGGNADASDVTITETIPAGTEYVSCTNSCATNGPPVTQATWSLGTVKAGEGGFVTLTVKVRDSAGCQICNTAQIASPSQNGGTAINSNTLCLDTQPGPTPAGARASGSALGAAVVADPINTRLSETSSSQSGLGADSNEANLLGPILVPGDGSILRADVMRTTSTSTVTAAPPQARDVSTARTLGVNVLKGVVTADVVQAVAETVANGDSSRFSSAGSTFKNLKVNGVAMNDVGPNTTINVGTILGVGSGITVALREESGSTSGPSSTQLSGGTYAADLSVTMIHVRVVDSNPLMLGNQPIDVIVSQAKSHADFPQTRLCKSKPTQSVSGHAFIASESTDPALVPVLVNYVDIPASGGSAFKHLDAAALPSDGSRFTATAADSSSSGTLATSSSTASSYASAANVCIKLTGTGCDIRAEAVKSQSNSSASALTRSSNADGSSLVNVTLGGTTIPVTPKPNTVILIPGVATVILNEQVPDAAATGHTGLTVRAIHVILLDPQPGGAPGAEVIVAEAHSDATYIK
ncbi:MAG: DUF11 domain-containing protein [Mycobacteriales bacterium]